MLLDAAKLDVNQIDHLYVAGGLGASVGVWSAAGIGLFPMEILSKFESLGNSSILGCIAFILDSDEEALKEIQDNSSIVLLATDPRFEEMFIENLHL